MPLEVARSSEARPHQGDVDQRGGLAAHNRSDQVW